MRNASPLFEVSWSAGELRQWGLSEKLGGKKFGRVGEREKRRVFYSQSAKRIP